MSKHASAEEKLRLIKLYYESGQTIEDFTNQHGVYISTFTRWLGEFRKNGKKGLQTRSDKAFEKILPQLQTEADLRKEILKLWIENERLKKVILCGRQRMAKESTFLDKYIVKK